jgi:Domain of unknown function (DUF6531)
LAPEQYRYRVSLPKGAALWESDGGAVISQGGVVLARIPAPRAHDAQGTSVPVRMSVSGDELVLTVAHRGRDLAYPLLVDPEIVVNLSEIPFVWEFYFVDNVPYYCGGEGYSNSYSGCHEEDPYFSHSEPGSGEPFAITLLPTTIPIYRTRFNKNTEKEEKVEINSANAEWWWKPSGNEGITAVEFEGIASSGSTEGTGYVRFEISACRQSQDWTSTEVGPTSYRFTPKEPFNCNKYNDYNEAVRFELYGGTTSLKEPSEEAGFEGKLSVNAILITRPISEEEKEEERTEKYGEKNPSKPDETRCMTEDPVNCATGNMVITQTDLSVGGRQPGLSLTRTYNSQLDYYQAQREEPAGMFGVWLDNPIQHLRHSRWTMRGLALQRDRCSYSPEQRQYREL